MKHIKLFEQYLFEYEIFDYKLKSHADNEWHYEFFVNVDPKIAAGIKSPFKDKLRYTVTIWHSRQKHYFNMYEVEFGVEGQEHPGENVGLDIKHFNSVLYTCGEIIDEVVEKQLIGTIRIQGAGGEKDIHMGPLQANQRAKAYTRWGKRRYGSSNVKAVGSFIDVNMKAARPKLFKGEDKPKMLIDTIDKYWNTDNVYDRKELERGLGGYGIHNFNFSSDAIVHKEYGTIYADITIEDRIKEYNLEYHYYDEVPEGKEEDNHEYFRSFKQLLDFIKNTFA